MESAQTGDAPALTVKVTGTLADVDRTAWNACAHGIRLPEPQGGEACAISGDAAEEDIANPFVSYDFLMALEASGSVGARTGWSSAHVLVENPAGDLVAAAPCYIKSHSQGEYVFDHSWADAYERAGGRYYPKLQVSVPFTPATGRRMLISPRVQASQAREMLIGGLRALRRQVNASSIHCTFMTTAEWEALGAADFLQRTDQQFHWINEEYAEFDDFLAALASRKRKVVKRERRDALANGITIDCLRGSDIREEHWDAFYQFYMDTGSRKWGRPYLTRAFFSQIGARMADKTLLVMAKRAGRYVAGAINFIGANALYGRNWGCIEEHPFLHFEVCYYQAIDYAIHHGLSRVEAGAQGEHKLARGYRPVITRSAHDIADPGLRRAVADFLRRERHHVDAAHAELDAYLPFRKEPPREIE